MFVTVVGVGYVGITTGVSLAYLGHDVVGVDKDLSKLELLKQGKSPIHEVGLEKVLQDAKSRISFTSDVKDVVCKSDVIIIAVGTPPKDNGEANTSYVEMAAQEVAEGIKEGQVCTIVVKSTVPIGSNLKVSSIVKRKLAERNVKAEVSFASNPEFLREGNALRDTFYPDRIVVGTEQSAAIECLRAMYRPILEQTFTSPVYLARPERYSLPPLITTSTTSAEMIKYASNAFLALKISYINEIAGLCERVGADVVEVARGMGLDPRIGNQFLQAGVGWGGSCFPKDTIALQSVAAEYGYTMPIIESSRIVNKRQRLIVIEKLQSTLKVLRGRTVGILGLAFKPGTDDVRDAPALDIINNLLGRGVHIKAHDPIAISNARKFLADLEIDYFDDPYEMVVECDALILITEWPEYRCLDLIKLSSRMRKPLFIDGRNFIDPIEAQKANFIYLGVGR